MGKQQLIEKISLAQKEHGQVLLSLIKDFEPLIRRHTYRIKDEDAFYDMQAEFVRIVLCFPTSKFKPKEDKYVLSYLKKAVKNHSTKMQFKLDHEQGVIRYYHDMSVAEQEIIEKTLCISDSYFNLDIYEIKRLLTKAEFDTIYKIFVLGYSVVECASSQNITRQTTNATKNRALQKLKKCYKQL